jgi:glycosyltransferase involved in cell wall biosynthesis
MRILIFNWRDSTHPWAGGAEVSISEMARYWAKNGHQVTWFCGRHSSQTAEEDIHGIHVIRRGNKYSVYLQAALCYLTQLRTRFDVILDGCNGIPFFTPFFSKLPKVVLVHHIHKQVLFQELPWYMANLVNFLECTAMPRVYRNVSFVTVSDSSRSALLDIGVEAEKISVIYNGVDHNRYRPGEKSKTPLMVFVGRLRYYKRVDIAIHAMPELLRAVPDLHFGIVGAGEAEASLRALAAQLGVTDRVCFHGYQPQAEMIKLYQNAQVVVNTSMREGWGLTVLEANACGTPVVAADVCGLCDSVQHNKTGLLVPFGDSHALAESVQSLLLDHPRRNRLAKNAVEWASRFNWERSARQMLELLKNQ